MCFCHVDKTWSYLWIVGVSGISIIILCNEYICFLNNFNKDLYISLLDYIYNTKFNLPVFNSSHPDTAQTLYVSMSSYACLSSGEILLTTLDEKELCFLCVLLFVIYFCKGNFLVWNIYFIIVSHRLWWTWFAFFNMTISFILFSCTLWWPWFSFFKVSLFQRIFVCFPDTLNVLQCIFIHLSC